MRGIYEERRDRLIEVLQRHLAGIATPAGGLAGLHIPVHFERPLDDVLLAAQALREGVVMRPLSLYAINPANRRSGMNLGFAAVPVEQIEAPALKLVRLIEDLLQAGSR
jgi:GntR family transcriptional regulator/MocR family aminotransferase